MEEPKKAVEPKKEAGANGSLLPSEIEAVGAETAVRFENPKWVNGTWDLTQFQKDGKPDWDALIDAGKPCFTCLFVLHLHVCWLSCVGLKYLIMVLI